MRLSELEPLQVFELDGKKYECIRLYGPENRIAVCYELNEKGEYIPTGDLVEPYKVRLVSDVRFNKQNETEEDRELNNLL